MEEIFPKVKKGEVSPYEIEENVINYCCYNALVNYKAYDVLKSKLIETDMWDVYSNIEIPLTYALYSMEKCGIMIKPEELKEYGNRLNGDIKILEKEMCIRDSYCTDVLIQVSAITAALNSFNKILLSNHISTCVADNIKAGNMDVVDELVTTIQKLMK